MNTSPDGWFRILEVAPGVIDFCETLGVVDRYGPALTHSYLVSGGERAGLIDSSFGIGNLREAVESVSTLPVDVLLTHYHYDHVGCAHQFDSVAISELEAAIVAAPLTDEMAAAVAGCADRCTRDVPAGFRFSNYRIVAITPTRSLREGDVIDLGGRALEVFHLPGHSPGSLAFRDAANGLLFVGDTAYQGVLSLYLQLSDLMAFRQSIDRLLQLARAAPVLLPGHYASPFGIGVVEEIREGINRVWTGDVPLVEELQGPFATLFADFNSFGLAISIESDRLPAALKARVGGP